MKDFSNKAMGSNSVLIVFAEKETSAAHLHKFVQV